MWVEFQAPLHGEIGPETSVLLCELIKVDNKKPIIYKSFEIDFVAKVVTKFVKGEICTITDKFGRLLNPQPFINLMDVSDLLHNFDCHETCRGLITHAYGDIPYSSTGEKKDGIWRSHRYLCYN